MNKKKHFQKPELTVSELSRALFDTNQRLNRANLQLNDANEQLNNANEQLNNANEQLNDVNQELQDTNLKLSDSNQKLQEANQTLLKNQAARMRFYANISHDLRAPITAISNFTEYILSQFTADASGKHTISVDQEELYHILTLMHSRTDYMKYLINDIFLLSSLESSDAKLKLEPVNVEFFLEDFFYMCDADSYYNKVELNLDIPEDFECSMEMDPELMRRVLDNLFTNAVKYSSDHPEIILGAYIQRDNSDPDGNNISESSSSSKCESSDSDISSHLVIYVRDNGIGISEENLHHIFDRSFQADTARTPNASSGSGLGLSIVKSIVELHHGTIVCESKLKEGSTFTITFPLTK